MIHEHGDIVMVEVPIGSETFKIKNGVYLRKLLADGKFVDFFNFKERLRIVGLSSKLSEDEWGDIIPEITADGTQFYYPDFGGRQTMMAVDLKRTATESGLSLLKLKNLSPDITLILKKQNSKI